MKERQSNIELFRIIAIFCILLVHCFGWMLSLGGVDSLMDAGLGMGITRSLILSATCIGVNCFILISGYFGLRLKGRSLLNIFLILFAFYVGCYLVDAFCFQHHFSWHQLLRNCFAFSRENWFVQCYLFLMLLSPILNTYVGHTQPKHQLWLIILLSAVACYFGCIHQSTYFYFSHGYSITSFILVYLIGRYIRIAGEQLLASVRTSWFWLGWFVLVLIGAAGRLIYPTSETPIFYDYCSPIQLLQSALLFLAFARMHFTSRTVNWLAGSGLAVFVFHTCAPVITLWSQFEANLYYSNRGGAFVIISFALCITVFIIATCLDKLRAWLATPIMNAYDKLESKWINRKTY